MQSVYHPLSPPGSFQPVIIQPPSDRMFPEGKASSVSCSVEYSCPKHLPTLTWNYKGMPATLEVSQVRSGRWRAHSQLSFTAATQDQGQRLICYASFTGGHRQEREIIIQVKSEWKHRHTWCRENVKVSQSYHTVTFNGLPARFK